MTNEREIHSLRQRFIVYTSRITNYVLVNFAVQLKKSPIPQAVAVGADYSLEAVNALDQALEIRERAIWVAKNAVEWTVIFGTILGNALVKAGIAYQETDISRIETMIVKSSCPGDFKPETVEASTQTEAPAKSYGLYSLVLFPFTTVSSVREQGLYILPSLKEYLPHLLPTALSEYLLETRLDLNSIVQLNVGGKVFATKLQTLCSVPDTSIALYFESCKNGTSATGIFTRKPGNVFYSDRNGVMFYYILEYLRLVDQGSNPLVPPSFLNGLTDFSLLYNESKYFGVSGLCVCIEKSIIEREFKSYGQIYDIWKSIIGGIEWSIDALEQNSGELTLSRQLVGSLKFNTNLFIAFFYFIYFIVLVAIFKAIL